MFPMYVICLNLNFDRSIGQRFFMNEWSLDRRLLSVLFHDVLSASPPILK